MKTRLLIFVLVLLNIVTIQSCSSKNDALSDAEIEVRALKVGTEAYIYAYPLVLMDITRRIQTNLVGGSFVHIRTFAGPDSRFVVRPNNDTLYSSAWLDLSAEPIIMHLPDVGSRYYLMPILDAWTNVIASPGTRTTGNKAGDYAIVGPNWMGSLPSGITVINSPSDMVWIIGRIYSTQTSEDLAIVHALQDQITLTPLSSYGHPYTPPPVVVDPNIDMLTAPSKQVANMNAATFFKYFANILKKNPPLAADASIVGKLTYIKIFPGEDFDINSLNQAVRNGLEAAVSAGQSKIASYTGDSYTANGWRTNVNYGSYGTDYLLRANVALFGLGANLPEDSIYPCTVADINGNLYIGTNKYLLHFDNGQTPPANAFWSLTLYNYSGYLVANPINRYAIHSCDSLIYNADGSLDIYIQNDSPGSDKESNWLPAPLSGFYLTIRIYWPEVEALSGTWSPPAVQKVN